MKLGSIIILILLTSCLNNKRPKANDVAIHKVWRFINYKIINPNPNVGLDFGSKDKIKFLDLTNPDTLKFTLDNKIKPIELVPYKIVDSIIIPADERNPQRKGEHSIVFRIWKVTAKELTLIIATSEDKDKPVSNGIGMVFKTK